MVLLFWSTSAPLRRHTKTWTLLLSAWSEEEAPTRFHGLKKNPKGGKKCSYHCDLHLLCAHLIHSPWEAAAPSPHGAQFGAGDTGGSGAVLLQERKKTSLKNLKRANFQGGEWFGNENKA